MGLRKFFGPSTLVTAAFIGPGTITLCSLTGSTTSYSLLWVLAFSVFCTIILQEMAARLGLISQEGLGEAINRSSLRFLPKSIMIILSISGILIGNAAYEAGNIAGAILGLNLIVEGFNFWPIILGLIAAFVLNKGSYKWLERLLIFLVLVMSISFLISAIITKPDLSKIFQGLIPSTFDNDQLLLIIGLIGTTVVPYNLFLHASTVKNKYTDVSALKDLRIENAIAIILGGLVSSCIVITAANVFNQSSEFNGISDFALQLEPLLGSSATYVMAIGFFAAGLSSAITAPLAAAYAAKGLFRWEGDIKDYKFKLVWFSILLIGVVVASTSIKPILIIKFAQIANGILLPVIAIFLLYILNDEKIMGENKNSRILNILGSLVVLVTFLLSFKTLYGVFS